MKDLELIATSIPVVPRDLHVTPKDLHVIPRDLHATSSVIKPLPWLPSAGFEAKMNVDGGLSRSGNQGASAVVCRKKEGQYLGASALVFDGPIDLASLEAHACNEVLALASDLNMSSVCVTSDCAEVVANIGTAAPCHYATILRKINHRRGSFSALNFVHEKRKHNEEAHVLAKAASSLLSRRHLSLASLTHIVLFSHEHYCLIKGTNC